MRKWGPRGELARAPLDGTLLPERCDAVVFSASELASCDELLPEARPARSSR